MSGQRDSSSSHRQSAEEIDAIAWVEHAQLAEYVPWGFFGPVQAYLDEALKD